MSTTDQRHTLAAKFYEVINSGDLGSLDGLCSTDLRGQAGAGADLAALKESLGAFIESFPDLVATAKHVVAEGDLVSTWVSYEGTHDGEFAGVPPTGRTVRFAAWDLLRVREGRIVEITQYCDLFSLMNQIGALPTSTSA